MVSDGESAAERMRRLAEAKSAGARDVQARRALSRETALLLRPLRLSSAVCAAVSVLGAVIALSRVDLLALAWFVGAAGAFGLVSAVLGRWIGDIDKWR